jgi:hypothetical protein
MASGKNLAQLLSEFANLPATPAAMHRLHTHWPDLVPQRPTYFTQFAELELRTPAGEILPRENADLHYSLWIQELVRQLWVGSVTFKTELEQIFLTGKPGAPSDSPLTFLNSAPSPGIFGIDWKRRRFEYRPQSLLQEALYFLFQNSDKAKVCANPECPAPYFIAPRGNTKYCSGACLEEIKQKAKRVWWRNKGDEWRRNRKEKEVTKPVK